MHNEKKKRKHLTSITKPLQINYTDVCAGMLKKKKTKKKTAAT